MALWGKERYRETYHKLPKEYGSVLEEYLTSLCFGTAEEFLCDLKEFSEGIGVQNCDYMIFFSFEPEVIPEMKGHEGVGFFSEWEGPYFFTYEEFLNELDRVIEDFFSDEDEECHKQARELFEKIKSRCEV